MDDTRYQDALDELAGQLHGELLCDDVTRALYSTAACVYELRPLAVVQPRDVEDVVTTVRICTRAGLPITGRGAGSGLVGQAIGTGLIVDFSRFLCHIIEIDTERRRVRIEPGAVWGNLQAALKPHGLFFPPDPSSGNYCTLGGMIATNASGAHSAKYGATIDYIDQLDTVLTGGATVTFREYEINSQEYRELEGAATLAGELHRGVRQILERYREPLERCRPRTTKNSSGYRLDHVLRDGRIHLGRLLAASEGTLGLTVGATLAVLPIPSAQQMSVLWFTDLHATAAAVEKMIPMGPSAIEIFDANGLKLIRENRPDLLRFLPEQAQYELLVKFDGDDAGDVKARSDAMRRLIVEDLKLAGGFIAPDDEADQEKLWAVRKALLPILYNVPGPGRILGFIEDVAVPPDRIIEFVEGLTGILNGYGARFVLYGHASQGNFHVRPVLNLRDPNDVQRMVAIADATFDLALSLHGTISGEHGDGLSRTPYLKKMYGDLYPAFVEIKRLFDPTGIFNPGRIVGGADDSLWANLRMGPDYRPTEPPPELPFEPNERLKQVEACHGCATCRTIVAETTMCPVFKVLRDEPAAPRAKANVLRQIAAGRLDAERAALAYKRVLELCIGCGNCRLECPSHVDVPKLMLDAKAAWVRRHGRSLDEWLLAHAEGIAELNQRLRFVANPMMRIKAARRLMEMATGIDARRELPPARPFAEPRRFLAQAAAQPAASVVYFGDIYANYNDPSIAVAAVEVLEHNGIEAIRPLLEPAGVPALMYGDVARARIAAERNVDRLIEHVEAGRAIVTTEPTAALAIRERYGELVPTEAGRRVAGAVRDLFDYLRELEHSGRLLAPTVSIRGSAAYHTPCHLKGLDVGRPAVDVLRMVPELKIAPVNEGCCGMAGTFGMRRRFYDLSMEIGRRLFERLRAGQFDFVLTDCSTCGLQIRAGTGMRVHHPIKVLWGAYGLGGRIADFGLPIAD